MHVVRRFRYETGRSPVGAQNTTATEREGARPVVLSMQPEVPGPVLVRFVTVARSPDRNDPECPAMTGTRGPGILGVIASDPDPGGLVCDMADDRTEPYSAQSTHCVSSSPLRIACGVAGRVSASSRKCRTFPIPYVSLILTLAESFWWRRPPRRSRQWVSDPAEPRL